VASARVSIAEGFDPCSGSVSPKQPTASPVPSFGSHSSFCSSLPKAWIGYITSAPWTLAIERSPESHASSSRIRSPYAVSLTFGRP